MRSFPLGFNMDQGIGFSENTGHWPIPEKNGGAIRIVDDKNNLRVLVLDHIDGVFYDITYGRHNNEDKLFTDKTDMDGNGQDIEAEVAFKEDRGEHEKFTIENLANRFYVRPYEETNRGQTGFDDKGFVTDTEFESTLFVDGEPTTAAAKAEDTHGEEIVYDRRVEGKRLQTKFKSNKSGFQFVGRQQDYLVKNVNYMPDLRPGTEGDYQEEIQKDLLHWYTRSENPVLDRIERETLVSSDDYSSITGPDGKNNSGFKLTVESSVEITLPSFVLFWANGYTNTLDLNTVTGLDGWVLYYGYSSVDLVLPIDIEFFDVRVYSTSKTGVVKYYYDDTVYHSADNVCPIW